MSVETCPLLQDIPWIKHGFFGKDTPFALEKPLMGIISFSNDFPKTVFLSQTHSARILDADDDLSVSADAVMTSQNNIALAIKTADCCPVFLVCTQTKQIANIHAGWRGALNNIVIDTLARMTENGAVPRNIIAAIGPSICGVSYPVEDDVRDQFVALQPEALPSFTQFEDRWKLDVADIIQRQLRTAGVNAVWQSGINTFTDPRYSSYRRYSVDPTLPDARNISIIMKTGD